MRKFRLITFTAGLALLAWLVMRSGPRRLMADLRDVGWWMIALLGIAAVESGFRAAALRLALGEDRRKFSFGSIYLVLMVSEAIQFAAAAGLLFGQAAKGWLLARRVSGPRAVSTVMIDVLLYYLTAAVFSLLGIALFFALYPATRGARDVFMAGAAFVGCAILLGVLAVRRRWFRASWLVKPLARWGIVRRRETIEGAADIDTQMFEFREKHPGAFRGILLFDFATHFLLALEVLVIFWLLGLAANYPAGVVVEGLTKLVDLGGALVPGDVGLYQGGAGLIFHAIGYTVATGVAVGVIRQLRAILWAGIGFLALLAPGYVRPE